MALSLTANITSFTKQALPAWHEGWDAASLNLFDKLSGSIQTVNSTFRTETYFNLSATPPLEEYEEGQVPSASINAHTYTLTNKLFGQSVEIGRSDFDDMGNNPAAKSMWLNKVAQLGVQARNLRVKLLIDLIRGTDVYDSSVTAKDVNGPDGVDFFSTSGRNMGSNLIASSATWDSKTLLDEADQILEAFMSHKALGIENFQPGSQGGTRLRSIAPDSFIILCPTKYVRVLRQVWASRMVGQVHDTSTTATSYVSAVENELLKLGGVQIIAVHDIPTAGATGSGYYVIDTSASLAMAKPILWQEREAPGMEVLAEGSDQFFKAEKYQFKTRMRGTMGWGHPAKMIRVEKET